MKCKIALLFLLLAVCPLFAQTTIQLWEGEALQTPKQKRSTLTIYLPAKEKNTGISVIVCPGGSYKWLDYTNEGDDVAQTLQQNGIAAFVLRYRRALYGNHHPAMIEDLQRAIQIAKEHSSHYGIDPDKLGVMGFSAGGHLVGTAATYFDTSFVQIKNQKSQIANFKPAFVAMIYPVVTMEKDSIAHRNSVKNLLGKNRSATMKNFMSLEKHVRPDMPPVFLLQCKDDKTVDYRNSVVYDAALTAKNIPHKFILHNTGGHGFGNRGKDEAVGWQQEFLKWLQEVIEIKRM
ncbi:endo-1,4-beta-xylanase [Bacteroidia bacterium]|nr:endo-1,4-beta-xylanase [Bacteroidia bacterium]